jgi:hypothetical protein
VNPSTNPKPSGGSHKKEFPEGAHAIGSRRVFVSLWSLCKVDTFPGKYIVVWKDEGGKWKLHRDI